MTISPATIRKNIAGASQLSAIKTFAISFAATLGLMSSAAVAQDERQKFPQVSTTSPLGVDLQSGRFTKEGVDLTMGPLQVDHYVSREMPAAGANNGRKSVFATSLHNRSYQYTSPGAGGSNQTEITAYLGKQAVKFVVQAGGTFFPLDSSTTGWKMVTSGANHLLTNKSGDSYILNTHSALPVQQRVLTSMTSANGHKLSYYYDSSARLKYVTSNRGYAVVLQYSGNNVIACGYNLTLTQVSASTTCSGASYKVTYGRDSGGKLTSITRVDGAVVNINYVTWQAGIYISCVTLPNSSTCAISNSYTGTGSGGANSDQVTSQTTATGETWNYTHIPVENSGGDYVPGYGEIRQSFGIMDPPAGVDTSATFGNGFVQSVVGPGGTTAYEYSTQGTYAVLYKTGWSGPHYYSVYPSKITYPEGNAIQFTRDWADNVTTRSDKAKPGSGLSDNVTTWTYPTSYQWSSPTICAAANVLCDKPTKVTDPKGNATDYTYSATHGGMLTETKPAVNSVRPQTRRTYVQRNAMIKSGSSFVAMQPAIWVLSSEEYCKTTAASGASCAGGAGDEVVTTYDYGPTSGANNLLLRGTVADSTGLALRTCYQYDQYGRKIAETQPKGTGSTCP